MFSKTKPEFLKSKIYKACDTKSIRKALEYLYFKDGKVVATEAHILLEQDLIECHGFTKEQVKLLDDKLLHSNDAKILEKCTNIMVFSDRIEGFIKNSDVRVTCNLKPNGVDVKYVNYKNIVQLQGEGKLSSVGINPYLLQKVVDCMYGNKEERSSLQLSFMSPSQRILITTKGDLPSVQYAIVMPINLID